MSLFVLIPGAGGQGWYWHRLVAELEARGHQAIPVDLPAGDDSAGWQEYADAVLDAIGARSPDVVVAQSMGAFTGSLVCERIKVGQLVLLNGMTPRPGETGGAWWGNTGQEAAAKAFAAQEGREFTDDLAELFFHDVPPDVTAEALAGGGPQSGTPFGQVWPLTRWPDVPIRFLQGSDDRLFPLAFQRKVVSDRLGIPVDVMPGGHLVALARPTELADRLESYLDTPAT